MVYGSQVKSSFAQTVSTETDGVTVLTFEYVDTIEMSDPRASGTVEWTAMFYSPESTVGGTWVSEEVILTNDGGEWVGYQTGTYILTRNMPNALTTTIGVKIGDIHYIGQGGYEGLRMDLYQSSADGIIGSLRSVGSDEEATAEPWSDVPATSDTVMVHGSWTDSTSTQTGEEFTDGVGVLTIEYSEVLEMSDPRASGATEYTTTLFVPDIQVGGTWVNEEVTIVNDDGTWVGHAMGAYVYTNNMPNALTTENAVVVGEWHLVGAGEYEGLRLDFYNSSDGVIGSIRPVE